MSEKRRETDDGGRRHRRVRTSVIAVAVAALAAGGAAAATVSQASAATPASAGAASHGKLAITKEFFGYVDPSTKTGPTYRYILTNNKGMSAAILSYGGIIQYIDLPGRNGQVADVTLGFKNLQDYITYDSPPVTANGGPYFGETIGRYGNRIAKGTFTLDQPGVGPVTYTLPINNGVNSLHGGLVGFGNYIWSQVSYGVNKNNDAWVTLQIVSPNGDASGAAGSPGCPNGCTGYPAELKVDVTFSLNNSDQLGIHYKAVNESSNLNTVLNLTNHSYFNLAGQASGAGTAYSQLVQINANTYTPTDTTQIPLGVNVPVAGTPFDFRSPHTIGSRIDDVSANDNVPASYDPQTNGESQLLIAQGYDHNWALNAQTKATTGPDGLNLAARALDPSSGRELTVWTDQPGVQFYSGNFLNGTLVGITGDTYRQGAGYTFETQHFPNSPNQPNFPSTELAAGGTFTSTTIFAFNSDGW